MTKVNTNDWESGEEITFNGRRYRIVSQKPSTGIGYEIILYPIREPETVTVTFTVGETP